MPRACRVLREGVLAGYLGEGPGPFIFAADAAGAFPILKNVRYTSVDEMLEDEVGEVLERDPSFASACEVLERARFVLEPIAYEDVFLPPDQAPLAGPSFRGSR